MHCTPQLEQQFCYCLLSIQLAKKEREEGRRLGRVKERKREGGKERKEGGKEDWSGVERERERERTHFIEGKGEKKNKTNK